MPDANQPLEPLLETGQIIPAFTLPGPDGIPHTPWTYKQREHLLLLFTRSTTSSETRGLLRAFAREYKAFREEQCAILAISPNTVIANLQAQEELLLPFPLLLRLDALRQLLRERQDAGKSELGKDRAVNAL